MGCTNSKENTNPPPTTLTDHNQLLINDQFRKWLKFNRPNADEYVLNDILSTSKPSTNIDEYRPIVTKALDLLSERTDIKTINKLNKLVQKEVSLASPKKVSHTIDTLKRTADKLHHGQINFDNNPSTSTNGNLPDASETKGEPGAALKEALEKARISFYKGKQAAIFANPNGGYDVRIIDDNDDALKEDGNLLRSIIVTEVKMRPKPAPSTSPQFNAPPPPPPPKLLDEREIGDDFRRSIDAALKGLEAIYHSENSTVKPTDQDESKQIGNRPEVALETTGGLNERLTDKSPTTNGENRIPLKPSRLIDAHSKPLFESSSSLTPAVAHAETSTPVQSPSHNVTYTEIIHSESRDGEQSRRFITESYDELPTKDDEQTTTLKVVTKSEFSNHPDSREKIMEQTVQIITVKVRNETTTNQSAEKTLETQPIDTIN